MCFEPISAFSISLPTVSSSSLAYVLRVMRVEECPNIVPLITLIPNYLHASNSATC